ncbi:MAG: trimeric intracellular cation channel family protein [Burkholderiaceae bacterium]|nr:trimeric intracellular cation channel family protein [Burkholderiaceae bacterium]
MDVSLAPLTLPPLLSRTLGQTLTHAQLGIEVVAIAAFALSGAIEGARKHLDAVGVVVVAFLTAFGGGTLRDVLLDRRPFFWVEHAWYIWVIFGLCAAAMLTMRARHFHPTERAMQWPDALGLGLFAASGTQIALTAGMPALVAVLMGVITSVFGGVLRDIVCNEIPTAFRDHRPYALCAFAGGWVVVGVQRAELGASAALAAGAAMTIALRVAGIGWNWQLPAWDAERRR